MTVLYDYWRSSAAYRLRIALNLSVRPYDRVAVDLLAGAHKHDANMVRNPQGLVPTVEMDGSVLTQSLAIMEYMHEKGAINILPEDPMAKARVRALSYAIAMEIHPVCNLSVARFASEASEGRITMETWMTRFIGPGLDAVERMLAGLPQDRYCYGDTVTLADICLVPQIYNANRWNVPTSHLERINTITRELSANPAFADAHPDAVKP